MATLTRLSAAALATFMTVSLAAEPVLAQITPGSPGVGPAGGVSSTTAPSNSQGTPAGGTGVVGTTRVGPSTMAPAMPMAGTDTTMSEPPRRARRVRHHRRARHHAARPAMDSTGEGSSSGLNGSNAPSR